MQVARVEFHGVLTPVDGDLHRRGTRLREFIVAAVYFDFRVVEFHRIALVVGVVDVFVDRQQTAALPIVADGEFERRAFALADAELFNLPLKGSLIEQFRAALVRFGDGEDDELRFLRGGGGEADNADAAAVSDLPVLRAVGRLVDDVDEFLAPFFRFSSGLPAMLPERSRISTISVGLETISGAAVSPSVTSKVPPQGTVPVFSSFVELVMPISYLPS